MTYSLFKVIKNKSDRVKKGLHNSIPLPFERFKKVFPGFVKGKYWIVTANSSIGKTKFAKFVLYETWKFCKANKIPFHCIWFALEESKESFLISILLIRLQQIHGVETDLHTLQSVCGRTPNEHLLGLIKKEDEFINDFLKSFEIVDVGTNPTSAFKRVCNHMTKLGKFFKDNQEVEPDRNWSGKDWDTFKWNDEEGYQFVVNDHVSLWSDENRQMETIDLWSKKYVLEFFIKRFKINALDIQQQALAQETKEYLRNGKLNINKMMPSANYLADNKTTVRNADVMIGLFSPYKVLVDEEDKFFKGYDISILENYYRCITINKDREYGTEGKRLHLLFEGATSQYKELPKAEDFENGVAKYEDWVKV